MPVASVGPVVEFVGCDGCHQPLRATADGFREMDSNECGNPVDTTRKIPSGDRLA